MENPILIDGFAFRIPTIPSRYRANCSREFGMFVTGDTKGMNSSKAEKAGLTRGDFVEMAICAIGQKTLTFKPHYENEQFTEVWGIPVAGGMKTHFHEKCSELSTFLIHRQSQDKMKGVIEHFGREAFNSWVAEGMQGDPNEYALSKASDAYFSNIFRFQMMQSEGNYGTYYYLAITTRPIANPFEEAAVKAARMIFEDDQKGIVHCVDPRLIENQAMCLGSASSSPTAIASGNGGEIIEVQQPVKQQQLKGK
ncbi:hypothetical protein QUB05_07330 [Microcoleus sp. F10-C6]|uniref:hypothetical protein n=1 Tax=unclassified Microcoleus TaxID=2642155 RepID=UPI002FD62997